MFETAVSELCMRVMLSMLAILDMPLSTSDIFNKLQCKNKSFKIGFSFTGIGKRRFFALKTRFYPFKTILSILRA